MILNGVCVSWQGWIDLVRLDGMGCLEFDEAFANQEDLVLKKQIKHYNKSISAAAETNHLHEF